jgi:RND family efflux transporter MFP subunit
MNKLIKTYHWIIQPILVVGILIFGFIGAMSFSLFDGEPDKAERVKYSPLVSILTTEISNQNIIIKGNGTIEARTRINMVPQVGGRINYIHNNLRAGGSFKKNDLLVEVESIDYELAITQDEAALATARTNLELEKAEAEASKEEWNALNPSTPVPTLVGRKPQIVEAEANVKSAQARLAQSKLNLKRTQIRMPFNGRVVQASVDVGEVVSANQQIGVVYSNERFEIPISLEVDQLSWINVPDAENNTDGNIVDIYIKDGDKTHQLKGKVTRIESELEELSRFARVIVSLLYSDIPKQFRNKVIPGLFVSVDIHSQELHDVTAIPRTALRQNNTLWIVKNEKLFVIQPNIVLNSDQQVIVTALEAGTMIVTSDLDIVTEGMQIRISDDAK